MISSNNVSVCAICLSEAKEKPVPVFGQIRSAFRGKEVEKACIRLLCNHKFHAQCIDHWAERSLTCPIDRRYLLKASATLPLPDNTYEELVDAFEADNHDEVNAILARGVCDGADSLFDHAVKNDKTQMAEILVWHCARRNTALNKLGILYQKTRNNTKALMCYQAASDQGYAPAQFNLGKMYYEAGPGINQNYKTAATLLQKAADQGHVNAIVNLARMYRKGLGIQENLIKAIHLYQQAAELGDRIAQRRLASMYYDGQGTKPDLVKAKYWYNTAALNGDMVAQSNLGWMHLNGIGTVQDLKIAAQWFEKAADQGSVIAQKHLDLINRTLSREN